MDIQDELTDNFNGNAPFRSHYKDSATGQKKDHHYEPDGSIKTDSVVTWTDPSLGYYNSPQYGWPAGWDSRDIFDAGVEGRETLTSLNWTFPNSDGSALYLDNNGFPTAPPNPTDLSMSSIQPLFNVDTAFGDAKHTLGKHTQVRVDATFSDGAIASNTFDITWHYPVENWHTVGQAVPETPELFGLVNPDKSGTFFYTITSSTVDYTIPIESASLTLSTVGVGCGILVGGVPGAIGAGLLGAASYVVDKQASPPSPEQDQTTADFSKFQTSLQEQVDINAGNTADIGAPNVNRFDRATADLINSSPDKQAFYNGNGVDNQGTSHGVFTAQFEEGRFRFNQSWVGDGYDSHGYTGDYQGNVHYPGQMFQIFIWTEAGQQLPNP